MPNQWQALLVKQWFGQPMLERKIALVTGRARKFPTMKIFQENFQKISWLRLLNREIFGFSLQAQNGHLRGVYQIHDSRSPICGPLSCQKPKKALGFHYKSHAVSPCWKSWWNQWKMIFRSPEPKKDAKTIGKALPREGFRTAFPRSDKTL